MTTTRATHLVGDGDLAVELSDSSAAVSLFETTGVVQFDSFLNPALLEELRLQSVAAFSEVIDALALRGIDTAKTPFRFTECCRRQRGRYDVRHGATTHPSLALGSAPWTGLVQELLGEDAVELYRGKQCVSATQ